MSRAERSRERGPDRIGSPTRIAGRRRPAVVVRRASDGDNAAVVRRAPPDHACPREGDRLASGQLAARVAPVVRGDERTAVEEIGRPVAGRSRPVVRPRLDEHHRRVRLGREPPGDDRAAAPGAHDDDVTSDPGGTARSRSIAATGNAGAPGGVQDGGGGPATRRRGARAARAAWRPARLRGAHADVPGNRLQDGLRDRRVGDGGRGGGARRLREGLLGARSVPARQAVSALAAHDRRERGDETAGARRAAGTRSRCARPTRSGRSDPAPSAEAAVLGHERNELLLAAVNRLPEEQRLVVVCRFILDLSEAETASVLGLRPGNRQVEALAGARPST